MTKMQHADAPRNNHDDLAARIAPLLAQIIALIAPQNGPSPDDHLPLADAARVAGTSVRVLRDAIRGKELVAYGKQRDRTVRRGDLMSWIESRKVIHPAVDDKDIERRMARLRAKGGAR